MFYPECRARKQPISLRQFGFGRFDAGMTLQPLFIAVAIGKCRKCLVCIYISRCDKLRVRYPLQLFYDDGAFEISPSAMRVLTCVIGHDRMLSMWNWVVFRL